MHFIFHAFSLLNVQRRDTALQNTEGDHRREQDIQGAGGILPEQRGQNQKFEFFGMRSIDARFYKKEAKAVE